MPIVSYRTSPFYVRDVFAAPHASALRELLGFERNDITVRTLRNESTRSLAKSHTPVLYNAHLPSQLLDTLLQFRIPILQILDRLSKRLLLSICSGEQSVLPCDMLRQLLSHRQHRFHHGMCARYEWVLGISFCHSHLKVAQSTHLGFGRILLSLPLGIVQPVLDLSRLSRRL